MPRHQQVTTCLRGGGPVSNRCSCQHCTISVCSVCGASEGSLTTDCPNENVSFDRQKEVYETNLDFTDDRGWHQGESIKQRSPRFEKKQEPMRQQQAAALRAAAADIPLGQGIVTCTRCGADHHRDPECLLVPTQAPSHVPLVSCWDRNATSPGVARVMRIAGCSCGWRCPPGEQNSDTAFSQHMALYVTPSSTDWERVDRTNALKDVLAQKAIAWVHADRVCEDHSTVLSSVEAEVGAYLIPRKGRSGFQQDPDAQAITLFTKLEQAKAAFHLADQRAVECDDAFRQAARKLVADLET